MDDRIRTWFGDGVADTISSQLVSAVPTIVSALMEVRDLTIAVEDLLWVTMTWVPPHAGTLTCTKQDCHER